MALVRFTTTRLSGLKEAGRRDELQHATIAPLLERELGADYGRLFADFTHESSDVRAWYVETDRAPRMIGDLPEAEREALLKDLADMMAGVLDLAKRLAPQSVQKATLARILTAATTFPAEDVWAIGDKPVVVNWGFHRNDVPVGVPRSIRERFQRTVVPPPPPIAVRTSKPHPPSEPIADGRVRRRWRFLPFLLWCLFATILAANYRLLLPACGLRGPLAVFANCKTSAVASHLVVEGRQLQAEVEQAELDRARDNAPCPPRPTAVAPHEIPPPPPDAPRGNVEVSLAWQNEADLDLIIECPGNDKLWHGSANLSACGGRLMRDINVADGPKISTPLEQAAWPQSPGGRFKIKVQLYAYNGVPGDSEIPFLVQIKRGNDVKKIEGSVKGARAIVVVTDTDL